MQAAEALTQAEIEQAGLEFSKQDVPPGVTPALWRELGDALLASLEQRARETSKLPDEARNEIDDLAWVDNGGGDFSLEWTFRNAGDYDNNGEVNVSDLSSIGVHFGKNDTSSDWATAQTADGDGNGEINIADVSPIGVNFGSQVLGYNVYASDYEDGPWLQQGSIVLEDASKGYPRMFSYPYGTQEYPFVTVSPFDATDNDIVAATGGTTAKFIPGETTMGDSATVDNETSAVLEGEAGTPIEGVSVEIPAGAMYNPTDISIGYNEGTIRPVSGLWEGAILEIAGPTPLDFNEPVLITVPFNGGADDMLVPFYINDEMKPEACLVTDLDTGNGTMTFMTLHTSSYYWLRTGGLPESRTSSFDPSRNGFQIVNHGSTYEQSGECMGMSAFAGWYFEQQKTGKVKADLFPSYYNTIGTDVDEELR